MHAASQHDADKSAREVRRDELLDAAADYVLRHGLSSLSIRPLASDLGLSHRTLLYYVESKDRLLVGVLERVRARDTARIREYLTGSPVRSPIELLRAAWHAFSAPDRTPYIRFFHEVLALGLQGPPYSAWVDQVIDGRTSVIAAALAAIGVPATRTQATATLITAAVRGLQLHLLVTGDRTASDAAFEELLSALSVRLSAESTAPTRES
jgi:AcrR family transcriptional regulator